MKEKLILDIVNDLKEKLSTEQIDSLKAVLNRQLMIAHRLENCIKNLM